MDSSDGDSSDNDSLVGYDDYTDAENEEANFGQQLDATVTMTDSGKLSVGINDVADNHRWFLIVGRSRAVNRVPYELWRMVFLCVHAIACTKEAFKLAVQLSSVCRMWRSVATGTGRLWSTIHFPMISWDSKFAGLRVQLARMGSRCLDITMSPGIVYREEYKGYTTAEIEGNAIMTFMEIFSPYQHRWRSVDVVSMCKSTLAGFIWIFSQGPKPIVLEQLKLCSWDIFSPSDPMHNFAMAQYEAPNLRELHLETLATGPLYAFLERTPLIETLVLKADDADDNSYVICTHPRRFLHGLGALPNLQHLVIWNLFQLGCECRSMYCYANFVPLSSLASPYSLRSLTHLTFRRSCPSFITAIFEIAEAPALFHISFMHIGHHPDMLQLALSFIQNSGRFPSVRSIYFERMSIASHDNTSAVRQCLKNMGYCTTLELNADTSDAITSNILVRLVRSSLQGPNAIPSAGPALCPQLVVLKVKLDLFRGARFGWKMSLAAIFQQLVERRQNGYGYLLPLLVLHVTTNERLPAYERGWFTQNLQDFSWG